MHEIETCRDFRFGGPVRKRSPIDLASHLPEHRNKLPCAPRLASDEVVKAGLLLLPPLCFVGCVDVHDASHRDSETVYLRSNDLAWRQGRSHSLPDAAEPSSRRDRIPIGTDTVDPLRARRAELARRVEDLANDEADRVCLTMELIPREQIFDRSVRPKKVLLRYINEATSSANLDDFERTLDEPRR
jgi:hypothetical protein